MRTGPYCEFKVHIHEDRSASFESTKHAAQYLSVTDGGQPGDPRGPRTDPTKSFFVYCKVLLLCVNI